jgi:hypothetical protein
MNNLDYCTTETRLEIEKVLNSSSTTFWLKEALQKCLTRDCVDAADDTELLCSLINKVYTDIVKGGKK